MAHRQEVTGEWFAGFCDGECCLSIAGHGGALQPRFRLNQRDDDGDLVRAIHAFIGAGSIYRKTYSRQPTARPQAALTVVGKDCLRVVAILDAHPLRSKKRIEYPIWREAVVLYSEMQGHRWFAPAATARRAELLAPLRDRLVSARAYGGAR